MRITENKTIYIGQNPNIDAQKDENTKKNGVGGTIFAGNRKVQQNDIIDKQKQARQKALKIVGDAFDKEKKIDDALQARREHITELEKAVVNAQKEIANFDNEKQTLKEQYNIKEDSEEQKDLKLLEKRRDLQKEGLGILSLSEEEMARLKEIDEIGMTEYQQRSLEIDSYKEPFQKEAEEANKLIKQETGIIAEISLARLKSHPIVDATKQADKVMEAASKEVIRMILENTKESVDGELEEKVKEAKEQAKEEEEKQEKIEKAEAEEEPYEKILDQAKVQNDIKSELENMVKKMKLAEEDMKGAMVDEVI